MGGPELLERLRPLLVLQNRVAAEVARTVRGCELTQAAECDGLKSIGSWLRGHGHLSAAEASRVVRSGRALEHLPATAAAFAGGALTAGQGAGIAPIAGEAERAAAADQGVDLGQVDQALAAVAQSPAHETLAQVVHHYREALDPDGTEPDPTEGRNLTIGKHADGRRFFRGELDAIGGE